VVEIVSLIWSQVITPIRPSLQDIVDVLRMAVYAIAGPRLILHLRGIVTQPSYATTMAIGQSASSGYPDSGGKVPVEEQGSPEELA